MKTAFSMLLGLAGIAPAQHVSAVQVGFEVEGLGSNLDLDLQAALKEIPAVAEVAISASRVRVGVLEDRRLKLSELKEAVSKINREIKAEAIALEGAVWVGFTVGTNKERYLETLKLLPSVMSAKESQDGYELTIKDPGVKLLDLARAIARKAELDPEHALETIKDVGWTGKPKKSDGQEAAHAKVEQEKVDQAIEQGCKWLLTQDIRLQFNRGKRHSPSAGQSYLELALLTLAHSGFYEADEPPLKELSEEVLKRPLTSTYTVSLQAMALQKINPVKYQGRLAQCAQFLVDNQCTNGQWDYGAPTDVDHISTTETAKPRVIETGPEPSQPRVVIKKYGTQADGGSRPGTKILPKIVVRRRRQGPPDGDNSNSQYAALGLRACLDAGIELEKEVMVKAKDWWLRSQNRTGGWGYCGYGRIDSNAAENPNKQTDVGNDPYGSMSVGGAGALCIYKFYLKEDYQKDPNVQRSIGWIASHFDVRKNPNRSSQFAYLYYLYGLERAGILYGTEKFGANEWYPLGANYLLETRKPTGEWNSNDAVSMKGIADTCYAILFLRRGIKPLKQVLITTDSAERLRTVPRKLANGN